MGSLFRKYEIYALVSMFFFLKKIVKKVSLFLHQEFVVLVFYSLLELPFDNSKGDEGEVQICVLVI